MKWLEKREKTNYYDPSATLEPYIKVSRSPRQTRLSELQARVKPDISAPAGKTMNHMYEVVCLEVGPSQAWLGFGSARAWLVR